MEWFRLIKLYGQRIVIYSLGLLCLAFGVALSVNSNLGVSPVNSLPYIVSLIANVDMGSCVTLVFSLFILVQIILLRKKFKWINLTQILFATMFGFFVDFAKWVLGDFAIPTYAGQLVMMFASIFLVALGVSLYMGAKLVNMPMEAMTHAVNETIFPKKSFHDVKVIMDCTVVGIGCILSYLFLDGIEGIREGTVICALLVGKFLKPINDFLLPKLDVFVGESLEA
jgi:uncharacterized membrane protein YczE